jgi:acetyl esterase/lipase
MNRFCPRPLFCLVLLFGSIGSVVDPAAAQQTGPKIDITTDVVYGHKHGLAMTFDVFRPQAPNGAGVLFMVSGGWYSNWSPPEQLLGLLRPLTDAGFTVFAVRHGSSPKFGIPEAVSDVRRAVRVIRMRADEFGIEPERLGVFGMSAGGHLSLMLGTTGDDGKPDAPDAVDRVGNRVQAVVAWVAPTDLTILIHSSPESLPAHKNFPALDLDPPAAAVHSPLMHVTADDAPALLLAGDADELVPIAHSRRIRDAFQRIGVTHELVEFPGAGHGIGGEQLAQGTRAMVDWFRDHLLED